MKQNKGEWSELYAVLYLLLNNKLKIVNSKLEIQNSEIFTVRNIVMLGKEKVKFNVLDYDIEIINSNVSNKISKISIEEYLKNILEHIKNTKETTFEIKELNKLFKYFNKIKGSSNIKEDVILINFDNIQKIIAELGYSIKSKLGRPATILNSSKHTNFVYKIKNFDEKNIEIINNINTESKLLDRIKKIKELGGKIEFLNIESKQFEENLKMIDSLLPLILGEVLLKSYIENEKDLKLLFQSNSLYGQKIVEKKMGDFLEAISFGMFPGKAWNGFNSVKGGIILVTLDGNVYILDLIYNREEVIKYLINETKLDTPSSSRYNMLNLKKVGNDILFTLNLQVRYK